MAVTMDFMPTLLSFLLRAVLVAAVTLVLGAGNFSIQFGAFRLDGIGTATFGAIILYALLRLGSYKR